MRIQNFTSIVLAAAMALGVMASPASAQTANCQLVSLGEVPLSRDDAGHLLMTVELNGKPVKAALDFERSYSEISRPLAESLGAPINSQAAIAITMGKDAESDLAMLGNLRLGIADLKNFQAVVDDSRQAFNGITVGLNLLGYFLPEFDLGHNVLRLFGKDHCADKLVYWSADYLKVSYDDTVGWPLIPAVVGGTELHAAWEPSRPATVVSLALADQTGIAHDDNGSHGQLADLAFAGITMHHVPVAVADLRYPRAPSAPMATMTGISKRANMTPTDMKLGADILKHFRFIIDFEAKAIYMTVG